MRAQNSHHIATGRNAFLIPRRRTTARMPAMATVAIAILAIWTASNGGGGRSVVEARVPLHTAHKAAAYGDRDRESAAPQVYLGKYHPVGRDNENPRGTIALCGTQQRGCLAVPEKGCSSSSSNNNEGQTTMLKMGLGASASSRTSSGGCAGGGSEGAAPAIGPLDEIGTEKQQWIYTSRGLLTTKPTWSGEGQGENKKAIKAQCLSPLVEDRGGSSSGRFSFWKENHHSLAGHWHYPLGLVDCPDSDDSESQKNRNVRFLVQRNGLVRSLARVLDPVTLRDISTTDPYCVAAEPSGAVSLLPCDPQDPSQAFLAFGQTDAFLMFLTSDGSGSNEPESGENTVIELAYHLGSASFSEAGAGTTAGEEDEAPRDSLSRTWDHTGYAPHQQEADQSDPSSAGSFQNPRIVVTHGGEPVFESPPIVLPGSGGTNANDNANAVTNAFGDVLWFDLGPSQREGTYVARFEPEKAGAGGLLPPLVREAMDTVVVEAEPADEGPGKSRVIWILSGAAGGLVLLGLGAAAAFRGPAGSLLGSRKGGLVAAEPEDPPPASVARASGAGSAGDGLFVDEYA